MTNMEKYENAFMETFGVPKEQLNDELVYQSIAEWDSVGHMSLIAALEDTFDIMMDTDDIIELSSYNEGKIILAKYEVEF